MASDRLRYNPDFSDGAFDFGGDFGAPEAPSTKKWWMPWLIGAGVIATIAFILWIVLWRNKLSKRSASEKFYGGSRSYGLSSADGKGEVWMGAAGAADGKGEVDYASYADPALAFDEQKVSAPTYPRADRLTAEDLLPPKAVDSQWSQANPTGQGDVGNQNFLSAGHHVGTNTIGSSLRNPNLQLRSEPINPQQEVGPWMQSTIEPDMNRRPLEIGTAA
jgi:hypothetical protein